MNKLLMPHRTCGPPKAFPAVTLGSFAILLETKSMPPPPYSLCQLLLGQTRHCLPLPKLFVPTSRPLPALSLCLALLGLPVYPTGLPIELLRILYNLDQISTLPVSPTGSGPIFLFIPESIVWAFL